MQIDVAQELIRATQCLLHRYRESDTFFSSAVDAATNLCEQLDIPAEMPAERRRRVPRQFGYEDGDDPIVDALHNLKVQFFFHAIDVALVSLGERFDMLSMYSDIFAFLYNIPLLKHWENQKLLEHCTVVSTALTAHVEGEVVMMDIEKTELAEELPSLSHLLSPECRRVLDVMDYILKSGLAEIFPNVVVALRIILSMPVSVASGERSFSKLKLIKSYLRSTIAQERLCGLSMISIEHELSAELDYSPLIDAFARRKVRRVPL